MMIEDDAYKCIIFYAKIFSIGNQGFIPNILIFNNLFLEIYLKFRLKIIIFIYINRGIR